MMMMMMEEDDDMEMEQMEHQVFVAHEIDLDYEFDAARYFDFTTEETPEQARQAELWFEIAPSYPPSPFVAKLMLREDFLLDNLCASPKSKHLEDATAMDDGQSSVPLGEEFDNDGSRAFGGKNCGLPGGVLQKVAMQPLQATTGLTFCSKTTSGNLNSNAKSALRKGSTLMKPTASQLAKLNRFPQNVGSRFQKLLAQNKERSLSVSSGVENQAAKRQKLEGGLLHKVADVKQQTNFVHKAPKKGVAVEQYSAHSKLRITIPREPDLETAHRAQRIRPKNAAEAEHMAVAVPRFKARPLNRKILDGPSLPLPKRSTPRLPEFQEFHLKTWERAQHTFANSSSSIHCNDSEKGLDKHTAVSAPENSVRDLGRPTALGATKHDRLSFAHTFKARPLNKKILSSKGDIGVFRNSKQETTVPMEFNFHTEKRVQHNPPIELFSKLSLTSEVQPNNGFQLKLPRHATMLRKDSKENIASSFHLEQKEKPFLLGGKQIHCGSDGCNSEAGTLMSARRSLGIR